jgi:hypothetical protein
MFAFLFLVCLTVMPETQFIKLGLLGSGELERMLTDAVLA